MNKHIEELRKLGCEVTQAGSRVTCSVFSENSDFDWLVSTNPEGFGRSSDAITSDVVTYLTSQGFEWEGSKKHYQNVAGDGFMSWRKDDINFIISSSQNFIRQHKIATALCKKIDVLNKQHRIAIFQAILYGNVE